MVSVLIRTTGKKLLLEQALASLVNQTYQNFEVVVVEDGPQTLSDFLASFKKLKIHYKALGKNSGRCKAGNEAMGMASGDYFVFLDEDDFFFADHLEQLVSAVVTNANAKVAYSFAFEIPTEYGYVNGKLAIAREGNQVSRFREPFSLFLLLHHNYIPINTLLFHRSLYEECGGFDIELEQNEDWNLWVRFAIKSRPFICVPKTTAIYRVPFDSNDQTERHERLLYYQELARKKQADLELKIKVGEITDLVGDIKVLGLREAVIQRFPRFRIMIKLYACCHRMFLSMLSRFRREHMQEVGKK